MSSLYLTQLHIDQPRLMRFAADQGLLRHSDEGFGYILHAWMKALFGNLAPKPFRFFERNHQVLGYGCGDQSVLSEQAQRFASPMAYQALVLDSLATKPMPLGWPKGKQLQMEVLACPVTRKDQEEKDVYLHAVERLGDAAPPRAEVYRQWFLRQVGPAAEVRDLQLLGYGRRHLLRRAEVPGGERRLRSVERPEALFLARIEIHDGEAFQRLLERGVGRHRAFGFGMVLLRPAG